MDKKLKKWFMLCFCMAVSSISSAVIAGENRVVVSIKPLHALVAVVMKGDREPALLVQGSDSPHLFHLKPSQIKVVQQADILFYIDDTFETFLRGAVDNLPDSTQRFALSRVPGMKLYPFRQHDHHPHGEQSRYDMHLWLSPANARAAAAFVAHVLGRHYPEKRGLYQANAEKFIAQLMALDKETARRLAPFRNIPFIVFHDAYQYYEKAYGLQPTAIITASPELMLGAGKLRDIRSLIRTQNVRCVFAEPQLNPRWLEIITEGTGVRRAELDPEGTMLTPGEGLYFSLMRQMTNHIEHCLGGR